ncbi:MAG: hypothetical protein ACE5EI_08015 [Thermodesulfobacteriota bacterium]
MIRAPARARGGKGGGGRGGDARGRALGAVLASSSGRTALESILVVILVFTLAGLASDRYLSNVRHIRAAALSMELANLRTAVNLYATLKGNLPKNLKELLRARAILPKRDIKGDRFALEIAGGLVESMNVDAEGYPLDPFGNRYSYDPATGMVRSTTPGYGTW